MREHSLQTGHGAGTGQTMAGALGLQRLESWPGSWDVATTFADGSVAHGTFSVRRALGGHSIIGEYGTTRNGVEFEGHWIQSRDPATGAWKSWWFDSRLIGDVETAMLEEVPGALIFHGCRRPDEPVQITERWQGNDEVVHAIELDHGSGLETVMTITYRRNGS